MKRISLLAVGFIFTAVFAVSAFAQTGAQPGAGKIGWIDTAAFQDEKEGIKRYITALKALDSEMTTSRNELIGIQNKGKTLNDEYENMTKNPAVPVGQAALAAKQDEIQKLQLDFEYKKKQFDSKVQKRSAEVLGPIQSDIFKALQEWAKTKGYIAILDLAALANDNINAIVAFDRSADITKEFVTFYNLRPAPTATTAVPK